MTAPATTTKLLAALLLVGWLGCAPALAARRHRQVWSDRAHPWDSNSLDNNLDNTISNNNDDLPQRKHQGGATCDHMLSRLRHSHVVASLPPDVQGEWVSSRCEVRPGPEFLLRKYNFINETHVQATQFYFADASCRLPLFVLSARATINVMRDSWLVPGGTEVDYQLNHVTIMAYADDMAQALGDHVNSTCPNFVTSQWKAGEEQELLNFYPLQDDGDPWVADDTAIPFIDRDCTKALQFSMHELQLMRVEHARSHHGVMRSLWLGDIHTDRLQRPYYRPTSYQEPLLPAKSANCATCRIIDEADVHDPPRLSSQVVPPLSLAGEWVSYHCETRPMSLFLTRRLIFNEDSSSWDGYFDYFADPLCRKPMFSIYAKGSHVSGALSPRIEHARHMDFRVMRMQVTAMSKQMVSMLNYHHGNRCGKTGKWRLGVPQDVTATRGCQALGLRVPHVEYDLVKTEVRRHKIWLYFGQRPSDGSSPITPSQRPTSFQAPLVRCIRPPPNKHPNALPLTQELEPNMATTITRLHPLLLAVLVVLIWSK